MSDDLPLMPKATAVWLVDNTALSFRQIAEFTGMHELEISGIADGEVAVGIKGFDPIANNQLTRADIAACEADPVKRLSLVKRKLAPEPKKKAPRYTPLSKRQDRPAAIAWLIRYHPELEDSQISKLVGTTKPTIQAIRDKTHWNASNIQPVDPVALGLCRQLDLDGAVRKAFEKKEKAQEHVPTNEERIRLMPTVESLAEPAVPSSAQARRQAAEELGGFTLDDPRGVDDDEEDRSPILDPDTIFNLPKTPKDARDDD